MYLPTRAGTSGTPNGRLTADIIEALQRPCNYQVFKCLEQRIPGYDYCIKHILEDKSAPYKQCTYVYGSNGRKCPNSTPITEKKEPFLCAEHAHMAQLSRQRTTRKPPPPQTVDTILGGLAHYVQTKNKEKTLPPEEKIYVPANPFDQIEALRINGQSCRILEYASESDSDQEPTVLNDMWRGLDEADSDPESIDTPMEDPLKYCGVYTAEEVTLLTKDKLIRLQGLYIDQFRRLQHRLRERRRKYLHALKKEKESLCSISNQPRETAQEKKLYNKLKALNRYHKRSGVDAILHKKSLERRAQATDGVAFRPGPISKCIFTEGGVKCGEKSLPVAKYCFKHILEDQAQVLFRACGCVQANLTCKEPIFSIFEDGTCALHTTLIPKNSPKEAIAKINDQTRHSRKNGKRTKKKYPNNKEELASSSLSFSESGIINEVEIKEEKETYESDTNEQRILAETEESDSDTQLDEATNYLFKSETNDMMLKELALVPIELGDIAAKEEIIDEKDKSLLDEISEKDIIEQNLNPLFEENISELMNSKLDDNIVDTKEELKEIFSDYVHSKSTLSQDFENQVIKEDKLLEDMPICEDDSVS